MSPQRLVVDVGGTNARFALADADGALHHVISHPVAEAATFEAALAAYRRRHGGALAACTIAAAGPVDGDRVALTNNAWTIDRRTVTSLLGGVPVVLVNDIEAVAAALPYLTEQDLSPIGLPLPRPNEPRTMLAVNVGTGFGAASAIWRDGRWYTCPSEAGHMTLGDFAADASVEGVLSGPGFSRLRTRMALENPEAGAAAMRAALDAFGAILGRVAGDLTLATCAWGGVYLCGSVALAWSKDADAEGFRAAFTRKGAMSERMRQVPTAVIRRAEVALFGLARIALPG